MKTSLFIIFYFALFICAKSQINYSNNTFDNASFSSAFGFNNKTGAFGGSYVYYSLASGASNRVVTGVNSSQVFGDNSTVLGYASLSAGSFTLASGNTSFSLGQWVTASTNNSVVIGTGRWASTAFANNFNNNIANSLMVSFNNTTTAPSAPSLFVGPIGTYNGYTYSKGCVGIGTTNTKGYLFAVNGNMVATRLKVATYASWPDYVFKENYPLLPLTQVEEFINKHHHLPGIDNAAFIDSNGYDIADMDAKILKQVEEIYIHLIELQKKNVLLREKITALEKY
ncbi:MAG: hypothetical protein WAQ28_10865 [Bacteroidia bacterium]|jgi:hypothetical protein